MITPFSNKLNFNSILLNKLSNEEKIELIDFISRLTPITENIQSLDDLKHKIRQNSDVSFNLDHSSIGLLVRNLIFKQFPKPALDSLREIISNAIDAQVRAGKETTPIVITIKNQEITIEDEGDGIGWSTLLNFFVPGRSSNPQALFQLEEGIPKVTGRFGQGGLSPFYFLYPKETDIPGFLLKKDSDSLSIIYCLNDKFYEVLFNANSGITCKEINSAAIKRKITIHTKKEQESIKMKFNGIQSKVFVDFKQKIKEKTGTRYTIISDLLEPQEKIIDYICTIFKFVTTPLIINGAKINKTLPHHLSFKGGTLFYSSKIAEMGSLCICENGKQVINFPLHNSPYALIIF